MAMILRIILLGFISLSAFPVWAGGAIQTNVNGLPLHWDQNETLSYNPEQGALKPTGAFDTEASLQLLQDAFSSWDTLPGFDLNIVQGPFIDDGGDVNQTNFRNFLPGETEPCYPEIFGEVPGACTTPIVFDDNGEILDAMFGSCAKFSILGFAGFIDVDDGSGDPELLIVRRGQALFSGACLEPVQTKVGCQECQRVLTTEEITTIVTHEVGHLIGMDHNQVNPQAFDACANDPDGCPPEFADAIPLMFPILVNGANQVMARDDEAYAQRLYGDPTQDTCSVSGNVYASDGTTELRGAEIAARNVDPSLDLFDVIAFVSGAEAPRFNDSKAQGNCREACGFYRITGLTPGETYQICAQVINSRFTGGSSIEPVLPPFQAFTPTCPEGLTVTCDCPDGGCPEFTDQDIITDADPDSIDTDFKDQFVNMGDTGGGCNFHRPLQADTLVWKKLSKILKRIY